MDTELKKIRKEVGVTKAYIAKQSNISVMSYNRYEAGQRLPNILTAQLIAEALSSTVEELFPLTYLLEQVGNTKEPEGNQAEKRN